MYGVEALPLVHGFSRSDVAQERALFVRVYLDLIAEGARRREGVPADWREALQACLARAGAGERNAYLAAIARQSGPAEPGGDIDALIASGLLDDAVALAADPKARLTPERFEALVPRARALARLGDPRLARALLSREPIPLAAAPLFLQAGGTQRAAILLAAQRAELGRKALGVTVKLREDVASRLEFSAIAGDSGDFGEALAAALGTEPDIARAIAADPSGESLALALIALGAPRDISVRIVTALDMRDGVEFQRIHTLARLCDHIPAATARRIVAAFTAPASPGQAAPAFAAPAGDAAPAFAAGAPREAQTPSPFLRREAPARKPAISPETSVRSALNSRRP